MLAAIVGSSILPWNLLENSNRFTSYLSDQPTPCVPELSSIAGVMVQFR